MLLDALKNTNEIQENSALKISNLFTAVDTTLFTIEEKIKDKENKLLSLQNKLNMLSQIVVNLASKYKECIEDSKAKKEILNNTALLVSPLLLII